VLVVDLVKVLPCLGQRGPKFADPQGLVVAIAIIPSLLVY
jgi:hypothetical protein